MKKLFISIGLVLGIAGAVFLLTKGSKLEKPPIVDHFACSDLCPAPLEQYMVKIYEGISDEEECLKLGGTPFVYRGWGEFHVCLAQEK